MRKPYKIILGILLGLLLVLAVGRILILDKVDYTPYFESDYYQRTCERLDSLQAGIEWAEGTVNLGFSRVNITPQLAETAKGEKGIFTEVPMAGYGSREGASAQGVHDSLYVSVVALKVGVELRVLLSADLLIIPPTISDRVYELVFSRNGINRSQLFFSATHTHASVGAWSDRYIGELFAGKLDPAVIEWLSQSFVEAIEKALGDLKPGALGISSFQAGDYVNNRLIGDKGEEDAEFVMVKMEQIAGKKAILGSFDAHATSLDGDNMAFSADYPGYWRTRLEEQGIDYAVFFAGSVGSHGPTSSGENFVQAKNIGLGLADSVWKYLADLPLKTQIEMASLTLEMDLPEFQVRVSDELNLAPYFGKKLFPALGKVYVQALRLDELIWATTPADFSGEMAIDLKNAMAKKGFKAQITSFNGAYVGYVIPAKYYHLDAYESRMMSWFGPGMGPYMEEMLRRSMNSIASLP